MHIKIGFIKPSAKPIRSSMDQAKLEELAQSIREQGILVPLMVRPLNGGYELIDGHRRFAAAKIVGLEEVPVNVQEMDDADAQAAALIAELQREDASPIDRARALKSLMDAKGWGQHEVARQGIMPQSTATKLLTLLEEEPEVQAMLKSDTSEPHGFTLTERHVRSVREAGIPREERKPILQKAANEELTSKQARAIAESVKAAPTPQAKKFLLDEPYSPMLHDPEFIQERAKEFGAKDPLYRDPTPSPQQEWQDVPEVSYMLKQLKLWTEQIDDFEKAQELGKISPEGHQFIASKVRKLARRLNAWADTLEKKNNE